MFLRPHALPTRSCLPFCVCCFPFMFRSGRCVEFDGSGTATRRTRKTNGNAGTLKYLLFYQYFFVVICLPPLSSVLSFGFFSCPNLRMLNFFLGCFSFSPLFNRCLLFGSVAKSKTRQGQSHSYHRTAHWQGKLILICFFFFFLFYRCWSPVGDSSQLKCNILLTFPTL